MKICSFYWFKSISHLTVYILHTYSTDYFLLSSNYPEGLAVEEAASQSFLDKPMEVTVFLKHSEKLYNHNATDNEENTFQLLQNSVPLIKSSLNLWETTLNFSSIFKETAFSSS